MEMFGGTVANTGSSRHSQYIESTSDMTLKDDAVALVDVIAPPDSILIGNADGQIYRNLWSTMMQGSQVLERPSWWKEFCSDKPVIESLRPKL